MLSISLPATKTLPPCKTSLNDVNDAVLVFVGVAGCCWFDEVVGGCLFCGEPEEVLCEFRMNANKPGAENKANI